MVGILLKYFDHEQKEVAQSVEDCLDKLTDTRVGMDALFHSLESQKREVRRNVRNYFSKKGDVYASTYASLYTHTMTLFRMAKRKDIPVEDIESLTELSKRTFLDGEQMEAIEDISTSLDLAKKRLRAMEQLKFYIRDMLKLTPELERMGVYSSTLEEPLRQAVKASKRREYDETSDIIEERELELEVKAELEKIGSMIQEYRDALIDTAPEDLDGIDVWAFTYLDELIEAITTKTLAKDKRASLGALNEFLSEEFDEFLNEDLVERVKKGNHSAVFTLYTVGITCLKLASAMIPSSAERIYQQYFRDIEGEPTIHMVAWPDLALSEG